MTEGRDLLDVGDLTSAEVELVLEIAGRPVALRASLMAPAMTSAPDLPKNTLSRLGGMVATSRSARRVTGSRKPRPLHMCISVST